VQNAKVNEKQSRDETKSCKFVSYCAKIGNARTSSKIKMATAFGICPSIMDLTWVFLVNEIFNDKIMIHGILRDSEIDKWQIRRKLKMTSLPSLARLFSRGIEFFPST
jgi:hypothetical protein